MVVINAEQRDDIVELIDDRGKYSGTQGDYLVTLNGKKYIVNKDLFEGLFEELKVPDISQMAQGYKEMAEVYKQEDTYDYRNFVKDKK